jgi:hypothetical protein
MDLSIRVQGKIMAADCFNEMVDIRNVLLQVMRIVIQWMDGRYRVRDECFPTTPLPTSGTKTFLVYLAG